MLARIKEYAYGAYAAVVAILASVAYYFFTRTKALSSKNAQLESENSVRDQITKLNEAKKEDEDDEADYRRTRGAFIRESLGDSDRKD